MRNRIVAGMAIVALITALAGCKKDPSIVGKWTGQMKGQEASFEFKEDKTMNLEAKIPIGSITLLGEYKTEGKNLTMNFKDAKVKASTPAIEKQLSDAIKGSFKEQKGTFELKSADELALTAKGPDGKENTEILKRVKDKA